MTKINYVIKTSLGDVLCAFDQCRYNLNHRCKSETNYKKCKFKDAVLRPERFWIEYKPEHGKCEYCGNMVDLCDGKIHQYCSECGSRMIGIRA